MKMHYILEVFIKILVTVGTQPHNFDRLLKEIQKIDTLYDVVVQKGTSKLTFKNDFDYVQDLSNFIEKADLIITHAGVGTIMHCLEKNKKVIVVPRLSKFNEHVNDHQLEICQYISKHQYGIVVDDLKDLIPTIKNINQYEFNKFESNTKNFNMSLINLIQEME